MQVVSNCYVFWRIAWIKKKRKQILESAQYRLEIIFKSTLYSALCITSFQKEMEIWEL